MDSDIATAAVTRRKRREQELLDWLPPNQRTVFWCRRFRGVLSTLNICKRCAEDSRYKKALPEVQPKRRLDRSKAPCRNLSKPQGVVELLNPEGGHFLKGNRYTCRRTGEPVYSPDCWMCEHYLTTDNPR